MKVFLTWHLEITRLLHDKEWLSSFTTAGDSVSRQVVGSQDWGYFGTELIRVGRNQKIPHTNRRSI